MKSEVAHTCKLSQVRHAIMLPAICTAQLHRRASIARYVSPDPFLKRGVANTTAKRKANVISGGGEAGGTKQRRSLDLWRM